MEEIIDYDAKINTLEDYIDNLDDDEDTLVTVLHRAQLIFGYIPVSVQYFIAEKLEKTPAEVYSVVTFYPFFKSEPQGIYTINVCTGTACFVKGAQDLVDEFSMLLKIKPGQTTKDGMFTLQTKRCIGACVNAPVITVNDEIYGKVTRKDVKDIIDKLKA